MIHDRRRTWRLAAGLVLAVPASVAAGTDPGTTGPAWSPFVVGALIGVLSLFTFRWSNRPIGASGAYASAAGLLMRGLSRRRVQAMQYYREHPPSVDWEVCFVGAAIAGAFVAAATGGELTGRWLPPFWVHRFGASLWPRLAVGFLGGAVMAFGARLAGGCTSGHGISGTLQLSPGSWLSLICFFVGGLATAFLLFRL